MKKSVCIALSVLLSAFCAACSAPPAQSASSAAEPPQAVSDGSGSAVSAAAASSGEISTTESEEEETSMQSEYTEPAKNAKLLYMGQGSVRIITPEEKVLYIDPYAGDGYGPAADLILVTHGHYDHNQLDKVANRDPGCRVITWAEALSGGKHQTFVLGFVTVEAVEAGNNPNHSIDSCVGYVLTLSDGVTVYLSGDTSRTAQMETLAQRGIDYAFFCCDGVYNMNVEEASECARLVAAKHSIPYHTLGKDGAFFDPELANRFDAPGRLIIGEGEEIELAADKNE